MRKYKIIAYVGCECYSKEIDAKNYMEAKEKAVDYGHKLSNYGNGGFLRGVCVKPFIGDKKN